MTLAETQPLSPADYSVWVWLLAGTVAAMAVFGRLLRGIRANGVQTRPDLLGALDYLVVCALLTANFLLPDVVPLLAPAVVILIMIARDMSPVDLFGFRRVGLVRACLLGLGLAMVALPLTTAVKQVTMLLWHGEEAPQKLVQMFNDAASDGNWQTIWNIAVAATLVAPLAEEILFRGYFYPVIGRGIGRIFAALVVAVLFGAAHDTLADIPGLATLSICLTLAYERTGSLLVPIFLHAWFNGISLLALYLQVGTGGTP